MVQELESMENRVAKTSKYKMINFDDYINENIIQIGHIFQIIHTEY